MKHFLQYAEEAIKANWSKPAITNYGANTYTYADIASGICRFHILFEKSGIKKGLLSFNRAESGFMKITGSFGKFSFAWSSWQCAT